jgi:hypothetical protein
VVTCAQLRHRRRGALDLLARRHQRGAVLECPAVILHVRDLDAARAERKRQTNQVGDPVDVGTMHDRVHREREFLPYDLGGERPFPGKCARVTGNVIGGGGVAVLDRYLYMVESGPSQCGQRLVRDPDRRGDEIGVKTGRMRRGGDVHEIASRAGLAARQMHLQHAKIRGLAEHTQPSRGVEFTLSCVKGQGIRAIGAAERTAMGQLGEEAKGPVQDCGTR